MRSHSHSSWIQKNRKQICRLCLASILGAFFGNCILLFVLFRFDIAPQKSDQLEVHSALQDCQANQYSLNQAFHSLQSENEALKNQLQSALPPLTPPNDYLLGVLLLTYDRYDYINATLGQVLPLLPPYTPLVISQDIPTSTTQTVVKSSPGKKETLDQRSQMVSQVIKSFQDGPKGTSILHIKREGREKLPPEKKLRPTDSDVYYYIASHYQFALSYVFETLHWDGVVIVEDDMYISADFFQYFYAGLKLMKEDPSLYCVSAWNDNGTPEHIKNDPFKLWRTDFFPGLGWLMTRELWAEINENWPVSFWDDWIREPEQRKGRSCIRPEISRTANFGAKGSSGGQFFATIKNVAFNKAAIAWEKQDLNYLKKANYDAWFERWSRRGRVVTTTSEVAGTNQEFVLMYDSNAQLDKLLTNFKLMKDLKAGVARTAYKGVITFSTPANNTIKIVPKDPSVINFRYTRSTPQTPTTVMKFVQIKKK